MSPRAAWRLESLGFTEVFDYVAGKADWAAAGLPVEGTATAEVRLAGLADRQVPTCRHTETVGAVRSRMGDAEAAVVVNEERVVIGLVRAGDMGGEAGCAVAEVMREGPSTYRPNVSARELAERLEKVDVRRVVVTSSDGRLVGIADPDEVRSAALRPGERG